ncbi:MAG: hypothetical protein KatS3mg105_3967 [Gemmatales bacterium]|nr:MAG: hypothetical protein KatS3mg105_3967 [Gemmatales bacterium]
MSQKHTVVFSRFLLTALVCLVPFGASNAAEDLPEKIKFNRDIRPILSNKCFTCHGPSAKDRKGDLRLDLREGAIDQSKAIIPGDSSKSPVYLRIIEEDPRRRMPPRKTEKTLTKKEIALIKRWIDQGAEYEGHWAYLPIKKPPVPQVKDESWPKNPIDYFILARLEKEGLRPSPEADRRTLIRRVTLDLTGLPPTPEEVKAFLEDASAKAYEKLVDRLLASPRYGEHMAHYWLDAVRYGDTHGLHLDNYREMWPYRDWVIHAFNSNMPYDQFTIEQLAGDLLPNATTSQKVASGYNRNHVTTNEGGSIAEEVYVRNVVDRVETTAIVWMGLTAGCAVCHEHKYDPLSQKEFYQMFAFFNNLDGNAMDGNKKDPPPIIRVPTPEQEKQLAQLQASIARTQQQLNQRSEAIEQDFARWLEQAAADKVSSNLRIDNGLVALISLDERKGDKVANHVAGGMGGTVHGKPTWKPGKLGNAFEFNGKSHIRLGSIGDFERDQPFSYGAWINWKGGPGGMAPVSRMNDRNGYRGYDIFIAGGSVAVHILHQWPNNGIKVTSVGKIKPNQWHHVFVTYDGSSKAAGVKLYIDGKPQKLTVNADSLKATIRCNVDLRLGQRYGSAGFRGLIDDVRLYNRQLSDAEVAVLAGADPIAPILAIPEAKRTPAQVKTLKTYYLQNVDGKYKALQNQLNQLESSLKKLENALPTTLVMKERATPRQAYVLIRGEYDKKGEPVERATPAFLPPMPKDAPKNRLGFAKWLVDPSHPLTSRVAVNRLWQQVFGTGIVKTAEDFGAQGEWPSHPELLDWLARQYIEDGWDTKKMVKRLVMSATYRQTSRVTPERLARDPENRLLSRGPRFRLDAEMLRDQALFVSGLLVHKMGGPSVKPPQPDGLWRAVGYTGSNTVRFVADTGSKIYRRSVYTFWKRTSPPPQMAIFDAPSREACVLRRERTNTPLQALLLMNEQQYFECARHLAQRMMREGGKQPHERLAFAYETVLARPPEPSELAELATAYRDFLASFRKEPEQARKVIHVGNSKPDPTFDPVELAAWTMVANLILNLDETVTKE